MNERQDQEELFCLEFEQQFLIDLEVKKFAERWIPGLFPGKIEQEHVQRYELASSFVNNKTVLDIACGCGFGSYCLAEKGNAKSITGCDINESAVMYGNYKYAHEKINRVVGDAEKFLQPGSFDVIISFETIEHLKNYRNFLENMSLSLKENGIFFVSTPVVLKTTKENQNPHHFIEWSFADFQSMIAKYFSIKEIYIQDIELQSKPSIFKRIYRKIKNQVIMPTVGNNEASIIEKYTGQYPANKIAGGFQLLVCTKK